MVKNKTVTFEAKLNRLKEIVAELESPELDLEKGMALYREGAECSRFCRAKLENARIELEKWRQEDAPDAEEDEEDNDEGDSR